MSLKRFAKLSVFFLFCFIVMGTACKGGGGSEEAAGGGDGDQVKVGSSCKGIGAMSAKMACVDNNLLFCSSYSDYKYKLQTACSADQKCEIAPDGKSGSCKPK